MIQHNNLQKPQNRQNANEVKNRILVFVRQHGPVLPVQVSRALGNTTLFAGAILSELIADKLILITKCKVGGSPLYYVRGQEPKLTMLRDYLSQRPKQAFDLLKEKKIVMDKEAEPWQRVALREIQDFAKPLNVTIENSTEIFWKWYMLNDEEAKRLIGEKLNPKKEEPKVEPKPEEKPKPEKPAEKPKQEKPEEKPKIKKPKSAFRDKMLTYFSNLGLEVKEEVVNSKKTEFSFVINVPSSIGNLTYLAVAKTKKKLSEDDVQLAYAAGIHHKLPVLLLAKELGKKAAKVAVKRGVAFKKI